jgi:hypothetical protein
LDNVLWWSSLQAWAGHPGTLVKNTTAANGDKIEVWAKPLNNITGKMAVLIMNIANLNLDEAGWATNVASTSAAVVAVSGDAKPVNSTVTVKPEWLGLNPLRPIYVADVWSGKSLPTMTITADKPLITDAFGPHDSRFYVLQPAAESVSVGLYGWSGFPHHVVETVTACEAQCRKLGHCCFDSKGSTEKGSPEVQCDGAAGRDCGHGRDANQAS